MDQSLKTESLGQQVSKVIQLADTLSQAISNHVYIEGDMLPSINDLSTKYKMSRDTVFKAFQSLRERGLIDSAPGKGYFVKGQITNVLLLLDQYTPFKEALYNSFIRKLPTNYRIDLLFHQYNERLFNTILRDSMGRYSKYVVMNFDNEKFCSALDRISPARLLLLDFGKFEKSKYSYICQDFDQSFLLTLRKLKKNSGNTKESCSTFPKV